MDNADHNHDWVNDLKDPIDIPSILYNTTTGIVASRGMSALEKMESQENQQDEYFVQNVFMELYGVFWRMQQEHYEANIYDSVIKQEAVKFLQDEVSDWEKSLKSPKSDFYYAFTLPTDWNEDIRDSIFRPLFIQAGLIAEEDHVDRLIFFSKIESVFRIIQSTNDYSFGKIEIQTGKQYAICSLDFDGQVCIDLELFSAQYPSLTSIDNKYIPQPLKSSKFKFPLQHKETREWVKESLEKRCSTILTPDFIDMMTIESYFDRFSPEQDRKHNPDRCYYEDNQPELFANTPYQKFFAYRPFKGLEDIRYEEFNLKQDEIKAIESMTINDIYMDYPNYVKEFFMYYIHAFFQDTTGTKLSGLFILYTEVYARYNETLVLLKLIERWLNDYGEHQSLYKLMSHDGDDDDKNVSFRLTLFTRTQGGEKLVQKRVREYNKLSDPKIQPLDSKTEPFRPVHCIYIDLLPTTVNLQITHTGDTGHIKSTTGDYQCDIQPLTNFISQSNLYERSALCITNRMKLYIETIFGEYLVLCSDPDRTSNIISTFVHSKTKIIEKLLSKVDMHEMFSKTIAPTASDGNNSVIVCHPGYFFFFKITYLYYLNKIIEDKLDIAFGNEWKNKNTAFVFSVEKKLLDDMFDSKETLHNLLFSSGILNNNNGFRKAEICTYGEEILPAIQQKLKDADFKMKSYFVVAQLNQKHIQLTLHQVVKLSTPAEDAATIIIQDEILHIEDVYDTLCKNIWAALLSSNRIDYCLKHKNKGDNPHSLNSSEGYKAIYQRLKIYLMEALSLSHTSIDMDYNYHLKITEECPCTIVLFFRDIIEMGIRSVIKSLVTTIAASAINTALFGHYEVEFMFLLGDPFNISSFLSTYYIYTAIVQQEINISIELKAEYIQGFALQESLCQLLNQTTSKSPHMHDRFIKGVLSQICTDTYGVRFVAADEHYPSFICMDCSKDDEKVVVKDGNFLVIHQKGESIPITGLAIKLKLLIEEDSNIESYNEWDPKNRVFAEFIRVQHSNDTVIGRYTLLGDNSEGPKCIIHISDERSKDQPVIIDFKHANHEYTLHFTVRMMGYSTIYQNQNCDMYNIIGQPLTLAYI